jgi:hypothetical protein
MYSAACVQAQRLNEESETYQPLTMYSLVYASAG